MGLLYCSYNGDLFPRSHPGRVHRGDNSVNVMNGIVIHWGY